MDMDDLKNTEQLMKAIAHGIDSFFEEHIGKKGFALLVFEFYEPGISNYISNASRSDVIKALRELADVLEKKEDIPPVINDLKI